jgi:hypothetical protein
MRRKHIAVLFALVSLGSLVSLSLIACGGGGSSSSDTTVTPTDEARTTCKPPADATPGTSASVPQGFAEYRSPERGYRVQYPSNWQVKPNAVAFANITGDAFFSGETAGNVNANVSITCETVPVGATSGDFIDAKRGVIQRTIGKLPDIVNMLTVNGSEAASVEYSVQSTQPNQTLTVDKIEVYFADDMGGWTVTLTAPYGTLETYRAAFDIFVRSYARP